MKRFLLSILLLYFPLINLPAQLNYENDVQPIFSNNCALSGCHLGPNAQEGMDLSSGNSYSAIVNVPSNDFPSLFRVNPGKPDSSYLVWKIEGRSGIMGFQMPFGMAPLSQGKIDTIRQWIAEGALNPIVSHDDNLAVTNYQLHQNYPNPFNPETTISFDIIRNSPVTLTVFNILGQSVAVLVDQEMTSGRYNVIWDGTNNRGHSMPSGIYIYRLTAGNFEQTRRMLLMQ